MCFFCSKTLIKREKDNLVRENQPEIIAPVFKFKSKFAWSLIYEMKGTFGHQVMYQI